MMRLLRVASTCRFFLTPLPRHFDPPVALAAAAIGLTLSGSIALAQSPAKGSPDHIIAVTSAIDGASIKANTATSKDGACGEAQTTARLSARCRCSADRRSFSYNPQIDKDGLWDGTSS